MERIVDEIEELHKFANRIYRHPLTLNRQVWRKSPLGIKKAIATHPDIFMTILILFICRNTEGNRKKDFYVNSIRQVERVTGYKFFPLLESSIKSATFDIDDIYVWNSNND